MPVILMIPNISEIKIRRSAAGITQKELAKASGVSQSLIAKIESGKISPGFEKVKRLFDCLDRMHETHSINAGSIMRRHVYSVPPKASLKEAIFEMEKHGISQLPVIQHGACLGTVTNKGILAKLGKSSSSIDLAKSSVETAMEDAMPTVQENTPFPIVSAMLSYHPAVLVAKNGKIFGIVTKSDLLRTVAKGK
ncbi:MAG: CBS domain-containing protein [Candidatus ainarchaeum sp.]|nr:CBS domain-containing protein [Candidatus ainarchaeum sp.]